MDVMGITIGIDLGTTNSVTCVKKLNVLSIRNAEGEELTPSCVTCRPDPVSKSPIFIVGRHSLDLLKQYPEQTITSVKRLMGRAFEDQEVQNIIKAHRASYPITTDASEPGSIRIPLGDKLYTPEMISGVILKKLIADAEAELQGSVEQVVVTVPAYFSDKQKFATRAACDYAGVKLLKLLPEPTSAALSFGLEELGSNENQTIIVFDLGGGTFDISILSLAGGCFMEITKGGDMWLGGDNIDNLLVDHVLACAQKERDGKPIKELIDLLSDAEKVRFYVELREKSEAAKKELSVEESATVEMFGLLKDENKQLVDIDVTITQQELSELLQPLIERVEQITTQILHEVRFEPELIDTVLMVGGSSLICSIQEAIKKIFGEKKVKIHPRPMLAIAEGAALMAAKMTSGASAHQEQPFTMMHSSAHDYYLQLAGGKRHLLVARNTPLPVVIEQELNFINEDQSLARLRVFNETDGIMEVVGELWFHKNEPAYLTLKDELTRFKLRFSVDENNIITMKASSFTNEQHTVEAQIARGELAAKLYNDLEQTLSSVITNCTSRSVEMDVLSLSRKIVTTILSASDPLTGETNNEQKQKVLKQINALKIIRDKDLPVLRQYEFALVAQQESAHLLSDKDAARFNHLIEEYQQALSDLDDIEKLEALADELDDFYDEEPIVFDLAAAKETADWWAHEYPSEAKQIRQRAKKLSDLYQNADDEAIETARDDLHDYMDSQTGYGDRPHGHFDRDVRL